jgi:hypothetical protein
MGDKTAAFNQKIEAMQNKFNEFRKITSSDFTEPVELYKNYRAEFLERQEAEKQGQSGKDNEILAALERMIQEQQGTTKAVVGLNSDAPGSRAKALSYSQMGYQDIWELVRAGG